MPRIYLNPMLGEIIFSGGSKPWGLCAFVFSLFKSLQWLSWLKVCRGLVFEGSFDFQVFRRLVC